MRVRTRNSLVIGGVFAAALGSFVYPLVYLNFFAREAMQSSAESSLPSGHNIRGAFLNSGMLSMIYLSIYFDSP
jgi:hypothetical protein